VKRIEHCMFCYVTANWRRRPMTSREVIANLIGSITTNEKLRIKVTLDGNTCSPGIKVSDEDLTTLAIECNDFHDEWDYRLRPRNQHVQIQLFSVVHPSERQVGRAM
jgi:hypothetical protein